MNKTFKHIIAISLILIVCWWGYTNTEEINKISNVHKPFEQQLKRIIWLLIVGIITWWAFAKDNNQWLSKIVVIIYAFVIITIGLIGVLEWKFKFLSENWKEFFAGVRLFLSSPLPFIFLWIMRKINFDHFSKN